MSAKKDIEEIFSKSVRSGRRTYFFDVRSTRAEDYYMTITESKKFSNDDGSAHYKKHKIYLYKEDFEEFATSFKEVSDFIFEKKGREVISNHSNDQAQESNSETSSEEESVSDIKIDDL